MRIIPGPFQLAVRRNRSGSTQLEHEDAARRAAAAVCAIYEACYSDEEWAPVTFEEAERRETIHYRQALSAAQQARIVLNDHRVQLTLFNTQ